LVILIFFSGLASEPELFAFESFVFAAFAQEGDDGYQDLGCEEEEPDTHALRKASVQPYMGSVQALEKKGKHSRKVHLIPILERGRRFKTVMRHNFGTARLKRAGASRR
jgi:hypothetical protein